MTSSFWKAKPARRIAEDSSIAVATSAGKTPKKRRVSGQQKGEVPPGTLVNAVANNQETSASVEQLRRLFTELEAKFSEFDKHYYLLRDEIRCLNQSYTAKIEADLKNKKDSFRKGHHLQEPINVETTLDVLQENFEKAEADRSAWKTRLENLKQVLDANSRTSSMETRSRKRQRLS